VFGDAAPGQLPILARRSRDEDPGVADVADLMEHLWVATGERGVPREREECREMIISSWKRERET